MTVISKRRKDSQKLSILSEEKIVKRQSFDHQSTTSTGEMSCGGKISITRIMTVMKTLMKQEMAMTNKEPMHVKMSDKVIYVDNPPCDGPDEEVGWNVWEKSMQAYLFMTLEGTTKCTDSDGNTYEIID